MCVNDLSDALTSASAAFTDNIKFYSAINNPEDGENLQQDLKQVCDLCELWRIDLNICKCCLLSFTRNTNSYRPSYHLDDIEVKKTDVLKDLGVLVSSNAWICEKNLA